MGNISIRWIAEPVQRLVLRDANPGRLPRRLLAIEARKKLRLVQENEVMKRPAVCDDDHRPDRSPRSR
jgi:hypothetical protein